LLTLDQHPHDFDAVKASIQQQHLDFDAQGIESIQDIIAILSPQSTGLKHLQLV
jgi:hypothetical protein